MIRYSARSGFNIFSDSFSGLFLAAEAAVNCVSFNLSLFNCFVLLTSIEVRMSRVVDSEVVFELNYCYDLMVKLSLVLLMLLG